MANEEDGHGESNNIVQTYTEFMTRVSKFEELQSTGKRLLTGFQQSLGFLGRSPINKTSTLADRIIRSCGSKWALSYAEAGCMKAHDTAQHVSKSKTVVEELECLLDDAASAVRAANAKNKDVNCNCDILITSNDDEELLSAEHLEPKLTDHATLMAIIYSMVKQDYAMQARIISSLNLKTPPEQLETYCQMWLLRPFVDDEIMHKAWELVP